MNITLRLYKRHDLDLIPIITDSSFKLTKQMKGAIRAYLRDEPFRIPIKSLATVDRERGTYLLHFCINREKEPDLFAFVTGLKTGKRNSALKNLLRYYLDTVYLGEYVNDRKLLHHPLNIPLTDTTEKRTEEQNPALHGEERIKNTIAVEKAGSTAIKNNGKAHTHAKENGKASNTWRNPNTENHGVNPHETTQFCNETTENADNGFDFMSQMEDLMGSI